MNLKRLKQFIYMLLWASILFCSGELYAQNALGGRVQDSSGAPLIGATVMVDGTSRGVSTDANGSFTLREPVGTSITISYIGYEDVTIALSNGMVVTLKDQQMIDDIVVVGYGARKKETLSGAIAVVDDKMLTNKGAMSSPLQGLQGQVPGVFITRNSSAPGDESWSMSLRGAVSANSTEPLLIVDGVAYESVNAMRNINPEDIESMSFLKDAAAAIYGARAAGGVVLITTKKAKAGSAKVEYSGSVTVKSPGLMPELMNIDQWADAVMLSCANDGAAGNVTWNNYAKLAKQYKGGYIDLQTTSNPFGTTAFTDVWDFCFLDQDWLSMLFGNSTSTQHNISLSGGGDVATYRVSLGYLYDGSTLQWGNNNNQRYNFRINNTIKLSKRLTLDSSISYSRQAQIAPVDVGAILTSSYPMLGLPVSTIDGKPYAWGTWASPARKAELGGENKLSVNSFNISEQLKYDMGKGFSFNGNLGYSVNNAERTRQSNTIDYYNYAGDRVVRTSPQQSNTYYSQTASRKYFYSATGYVNYVKTVCDDHNFNVMAGAQYEMEDYSYFGARVKDINSSLDGLLGSGEITFEHSAGSSMKYQYGLASIFGRLNYDYKSKYLIEANLRYDGSSKFVKGNRWDLFYGFSGAWRIGQEGALKDLEWLNELKLRASYGVVGNQSGIGYYDGVQLYNLNSNNGAYIGSGLLSNITTSGTLASSAREWERIHNYNIGLDFGFLKNRLTGSVEYFQKRNNNMLINASFPGILGENAPTTNSGKFRAWGVEGTALWRDKIGNSGLNYYVGGSWSFARNKLTDIGGTSVKGLGFKGQQQGYPLNSVFGLRYAGKIQTQEQLDAYLTKYYPNNGINMPNNLRLGDHMYEDVNEDGKLDEDDIVFLGTDTPEISYSFNFGLSWKGLEVGVVFQGAANRTVFRSSDNNWRVPMRS